MGSILRSAFRRSGAAFIAPLAIVLAAGALLAVRAREQPRLHATGSFGADLDGDGLNDGLEKILATSPSQIDTDGDGYSDAEELARKSSPIYSEFVPETPRPSVGMSCYATPHRVHLVIAVYLPEADYANVAMHLGVAIGNRLVPLPDSLLLANASFAPYPAHLSQASVAIVDVPVEPSWVRNHGDISFFVTISGVVSGVVVSADAIHLRMVGPVIVLEMKNPFYNPLGLMTGGRPHGNGAGTIYRPLTGDDTPPGWTPGQICAQTSQAVGTSGALITNEVVSAGCEGGWDGSCPPDCSASVGSTYTTVDPVRLIGG